MCFGRYMKRLSQKQNMHSFCNKPTFGAVPQTAPGPFAVQKRAIQVWVKSISAYVRAKMGVGGKTSASLWAERRSGNLAVSRRTL